MRAQRACREATGISCSITAKVVEEYGNDPFGVTLIVSGIVTRWSEFKGTDYVVYESIRRWRWFQRQLWQQQKSK